ncbi:MAG: nitroreductase family protein [Fimbriimonadaceae bacterium]|nr:nitroreductase family protein [Fimbriimonadaceae bacterium]
MALDTLTTIRTRRSVRVYRPEPLAAGHLDELLAALRLAPSAKNLQPWHFLVVQDAEVKADLAAACREQHWMANAALIVCAVGLPEQSPKWYPIDCAIALQNLVLAATSLGYGACWIGAFDEAAVKDVLGIPAEGRVVALAPVGVPAETPPARDRKPAAATISGDRWGEPLS